MYLKIRANGHRWEWKEKAGKQRAEVPACLQGSEIGRLEIVCDSFHLRQVRYYTATAVWIASSGQYSPIGEAEIAYEPCNW